MASYFYEKHVPDYTDIDNKTGKAPGYRVSVCENDAGVGLMLEPYVDNPSPTLDMDKYHAVFFNIKEAKDLLLGLQTAINRACQKTNGNDLHPNRVQDC